MDKKKALEMLAIVADCQATIHHINDKAEKINEGPEIRLKPSEMQLILTIQMIQIGALKDILKDLIESR